MVDKGAECRPIRVSAMTAQIGPMRATGELEVMSVADFAVGANATEKGKFI